MPTDDQRIVWVPPELRAEVLELAEAAGWPYLSVQVSAGYRRGLGGDARNWELDVSRARRRTLELARDALTKGPTP